MYTFKIREYPDDVTEKRRQEIHAKLDQYGPKSEAHATDLVKTSPIQIRTLLISFASAAVLILIGIVLLQLSREFREYDDRGFMFLAFFLPWWWLVASPISELLFPEPNVLNMFRRARFSWNYVFYAGIGMVLAFAVAFAIGDRPGVISADERSRTNALMAVSMVATGFLGAWSAVLRGRTYELDLLQKWMGDRARLRAV